MKIQEESKPEISSYNIEGQRDPKTGAWHAYTPKEIAEAKRLVTVMKEGFSDFTLEYARDLLPLVVSLMFDEQLKLQAKIKALTENKLALKKIPHNPHCTQAEYEQLRHHQFRSMSPDDNSFLQFDLKNLEEGESPGKGFATLKSFAIYLLEKEKPAEPKAKTIAAPDL